VVSGASEEQWNTSTRVPAKHDTFRKCAFREKIINYMGERISRARHPVPIPCPSRAHPVPATPCPPCDFGTPLVAQRPWEVDAILFFLLSVYSFVSFGCSLV